MISRLSGALAVVVSLAGIAAGQSGVAPMPQMNLEDKFNFAKPDVTQAQAVVPAPVIPEFAVGGGGSLFPQEKPPKIWSGGGEFGLNGASGNTELFNLRAGLNAQRKTDDNLFTASLLYTYANQMNVLTQNQMLFNARDEILFTGGPWSVFASSNIEYDELRLYQFLVGTYAGVGYQFIDNAKTNWRGRAGAGAVYEFARESSGVPSRWVPELLFGTDFNHKFDDRQSFESTVEYYPRVDNFSQYRLRARAAYAIILDKDLGIALRLGMQNRFDSNPGPGFRQNDLTYFATLGFSF